MKRKAFTLVEMLIVITIVSLLAVLAVSSYGAARRVARLDLAADSIVSTLKERQLKAKSGAVEAEDASWCYGVLFATEDVPVEVVQTPYYSDCPSGADYCDLNVELERTPLDAARDFKVLKIESFGNDEQQLLILFKPPFARVVLGTVNYVMPPGSGSPEVFITVGLPQGDGQRTVHYNVVSNVIERLYEATTQQ